jgi:hypothetical protein
VTNVQCNRKRGSFLLLTGGGGIGQEAAASTDGPSGYGSTRTLLRENSHVLQTHKHDPNMVPEGVAATLTAIANIA